MSAELDRINRELFEESMEIIKAAWNNERFSFSGKHFTLPAARHPRPRAPR
jgi:alkanesulfonate monooxygenase SsuD/methylene tetrahydromethanopterin reductase-like flavin-dependent oxidoreductase (luciferase family)